MGAHKRADFETRKAQAIARQEHEAAERKRRWDEREAAMTPEEKKKRNKSRLALGQIMAMANSFRYQGW